MPSRKQVHAFLSRARGGRPLRPAKLELRAPDPRLNVLVLQGVCKISVGPLDIPVSSEGMRFYVGGWLSRERCAAVPLDNAPNVSESADNVADGSTFSLRLPFDPVADFDLLKLQILCVRRDPDSKQVKPFPVLAGLSCMHKLASGEKDVIHMTDPFQTPVAAVIELSLKTSIDSSRLRRSALYKVKDHNETLQQLSKSLLSTTVEGNIRVPEPVKPFIGGLSFLSNSGNPSLDIPPPAIHYATLNQNLSGLDRRLPHAVLAYFLQMVVTQSGMTIEEANALPPREFAQLAGDVLWGVTADARAAPYVPDENLALGIVLDPTTGFRLQINSVVSEDVGEPYSVFSYLHQTFEKPSRVSTQLNLAASQDGAAVFAAHRDALQAAQNSLVEVERSIMKDDCETSTTAAQIAVNTVRDGDMSMSAFLSELHSVSVGAQISAHRESTEKDGVFRNWTPKCYESAAHFFTRLQGMLRSGEIQIKLVVGLAGAASADAACESNVESIDQAANLCGHCFAVLRHQEGCGQPYVRLLEGTTNMRVYADQPDGPKYTCKINKNGEPTSMELPMSKFLTLLSQTAEKNMRVINVAMDQPMDLASVGAVKGGTITGLARTTIVTQCLHTQTSPKDMVFYRWCMFTGLAGDRAECGSLPLDENEFPNMLSAGCRPATLANVELKGLGFTENGPGHEILDEVWPPLADKALFHRLLSLWETPPALSAANADLKKRYRAGVTYTTVSFFESPSSPQILDQIYGIKKIHADTANKIQQDRPDSDGIFMTVHAMGTGVCCTLHVPEQSQTHTFIDSLTKARAVLKMDS